MGRRPAPGGAVSAAHPSTRSTHVPWSQHARPDAVPAPRRRGNALEQTLRLAFPIRPPQGHSGRHRRRCALPVPLIPATPQPPLGGSADRSRSSRERLGRSSQRSWRLSAQSCAPPKAGTSVSSSLVPRLCTVLPQGSCVKVWPSAALAAGAVATGRADTPGTHGVRGAHQQDGHRRRAASEGKRAGQAGFGNRHDACRRKGARSRLAHLPRLPSPCPVASRPRLARSGAIHRMQAARPHSCQAWRCSGGSSLSPGAAPGASAPARVEHQHSQRGSQRTGQCGSQAHTRRSPDCPRCQPGCQRWTRSRRYAAFSTRT